MYIKFIFAFCLVFLCCETKKLVIQDTKDYIAFDRFLPNGDYNIWLINIDTSLEYKLTSTKYREHMPVWFNDSELLYVFEPQPASYTESNFIMLNINSGKQKLIDYWSWEDSPGVGKYSSDTLGTIYYQIYDDYVGEVIALSIYKKTSKLKIFIPYQKFKLSGLMSISSPVISPNGKKMLLTACDTLKYRFLHQEPKKFYNNIYYYNRNDFTIKRLTYGDYDNNFASWISNDSIIFSSNRDGNWELYLMNSDDNDLKRLTFTDSTDEWQGATVSPDHKKICYAGYDNVKEELELWIMDLATGEKKFLTNGGNPAWSPKQ